MYPETMSWSVPQVLLYEEDGCLRCTPSPFDCGRQDSGTRRGCSSPRVARDTPGSGGLGSVGSVGDRGPDTRHGHRLRDPGVIRSGPEGGCGEPGRKTGMSKSHHNFSSFLDCLDYNDPSGGSGRRRSRSPRPNHECVCPFRKSKRTLPVLPVPYHL